MTRIVVIGNGMAGTRLVQELRARDPQQRMQITVLGAEREAAYNRVLLSSVLAGSLTPTDVEMVPSAWYAAEDVDLRTGVEVTEIDRANREVRTSTGDVYGYDHLVLATGSGPWVPPIRGLIDAAGELADGVVAFRTMSDCQTILDRVRDAGRVVILGGGLLGLEAARGLAGRNVQVEVIQAAEWLMQGQLDRDGGQVLARTLRELGVTVRLGALTKRYEADPERRALVLDDGTTISCDLVIVACGVRPSVRLAAAAGLKVDQGVEVDDRLTSLTDPRVHAIGDCAQHAGRVYGLVAPAWDQAAVLADALAGGDASYAGSQVVTRLKAADIDLATMGEADVDEFDTDLEVLRFTDPYRGTYQKVVIRDERVVGAIMLGCTETVGTVTQLFDREHAVPPDRRALFFPFIAAAGASPATDPADLPDEQVVCRCNNVSCGQIRAACADGACTVADIATATRATTGCGSCRATVAGIVTASSPSAIAEVPA
jgi:assimilatory nitrate reductase electron transfer subunit